MNITIRHRSGVKQLGSLLLLGAVVATAVGLASLDDLRRYLRMRSM
jgi:hypothetical protein